MSSPNSYVQQVSEVLSQLTKDIDACDLKWTLFVSAAQSYRYDSRLSPYPAQFISSKDKFDIDRILELITKVPTFQKLRQLLHQTDHGNAPTDVIDLLHFVLCKLTDPYLQSVGKAQVSIRFVHKFGHIFNFNFYYSSVKYCKKLHRLCRVYCQHTSSKLSLSRTQWLR